MEKARVARGKGPTGKLTKNNYRKKSLPHLEKDFQGRCAYCLASSELRAKSLTHVDHFDCKLPERKRHQYANLMLACASCNTAKHDKPIKNPYAPDQRLLNCTNESEFPDHITEGDDGVWVAKTRAGGYHIACIKLNEPSLVRMRKYRRSALERALSFWTEPIRFKRGDVAAHVEKAKALSAILFRELMAHPPMVTGEGLIEVESLLRNAGLPDDQIRALVGLDAGRGSAKGVMMKP